MRVVADSGALYALYDTADAHHRSILNLVRKFKPTLVVPTVILSEVDYLLREFLGVDAELDFIESLLGGYYVREPFSDDDLKRCRELLKLYRDLDLGLADAAIMATAERLNIRHVLTVDLKHFRAVKPKKGSFILLPFDLPE